MPDLLDHLSLPESVHQLLRRRILNNELVAGTRLIEARLALELGVSRATVRQALRQLAHEGLVEISPRRGSVVCRLSSADIRDACYARYVLEEGAVRVVLAHGVAPLIEPMAQLLRDMTAAAGRADMAAMVDLDTAFHGCIVRAALTPRLESLWATLNAQMGAVMRSSVEDQHIELAETVVRHGELLDALRGGDADLIRERLYRHYLRSDHEL